MTDLFDSHALPPTMTGPEILALLDDIERKARAVIDSATYLPEEIRAEQHRLIDAALIKCMLQIVPPEGSS
jgi:hypothetical protein